MKLMKLDDHIQFSIYHYNKWNCTVPERQVCDKRRSMRRLITVSPRGLLPNGEWRNGSKRN
ncbi:MAG: hypothetical protein HDR88_18990 [Bacteroides sp.]|nr:hypothetical protein [Bacteroides sp.]